MNYYRKLKIKDIEYKYHISKGDIVKIVTPNGNLIVKKIDIALDAGTRWLITPGMIKDYIINGKIKYVYWCDECYKNYNGDFI